MFAVIRVRGSLDLKPQLRKTLEMLRLHKINHLVLVPEHMLGMVKKVRVFVTYGEVDEAVLARLLEKRARLAGNKRLDEKFLKRHKLKGFDELAKRVIGGTALQEFGITPVLRLNSPKKGNERAGIKKVYSVGGAAGYRANDINILITKMM